MLQMVMEHNQTSLPSPAAPATEVPALSPCCLAAEMNQKHILTERGYLWRIAFEWTATCSTVLLYLLGIGASAHDCCVMMNGSGDTLISPRNGQSSAIIITMISPSVAASVPVIARCMPKFS
jgi:hypothetical protein